jgi:hypothetical protein
MVWISPLDHHPINRISTDLIPYIAHQFALHPAGPSGM